jgi:uncharacterized protein
MPLPTHIQERKESNMSSQIEAVKGLYAAFGRGDLPAILGQLADDIVWESEGPAAISFAGIRHGIPETTGFFEALARDHSDSRVTIADYVGDADTVMTLGRYAATMKATGKKLDSPIAHYWKFRAGKIIRYVGLVDTAAAVEAMRPSVAQGAVAITFAPTGMSPEKYAEVIRRLERAGAAAPSGRLLHLYYGPADATRVLDVWASMEQFEQFKHILKPILDSLGIDVGMPDIQPWRNSIVSQ